MSSEQIMSSELVDAKIEVSEARTDTKFAQLDTKFATVLGRIDTLQSHVDTTRWIVGIGMAFIALLIGIMEVIGK